MKKIIKFLSVFTVTSLPLTSIVSCSEQKKDEDTKIIHLNLIKSIFETGILLNSSFKGDKCDKTTFENSAIEMMNKQKAPDESNKEPNILITSNDIEFNYYSNNDGSSQIEDWPAIDVKIISESANLLSDNTKNDDQIFCKIKSNSNKTLGETDIFLVQVYKIND